MKNMKFIEDFYYGNIDPQEMKSELTDDMKKQLNKLVETEEQLREKLKGADKDLFNTYVEQYNKLMSISNEHNFINGFRLGGKLFFDVITKE